MKAEHHQIRELRQLLEAVGADVTPWSFSLTRA
jgi:hypothetical protein